MWIKELIGENFSGMNFRDTYGSKEVKLSGRNRSGKSTRSKAFFWLLSGFTDANQPMNSNLYDNRVELSKDTPEARVCATVVLDNGEEYTIERVARAKYQRRRGTNSWEKASSDEYVYRIDNIERSASDFRDWISANIAQEDLIRFCLDGSFFINLLSEDKRKARNLIEKVVGSVTREEMSGDYGLIDKLLERYSLDEIDTQAANLAKGISQRLDEIPSLIQSCEREIAEIEQVNFKQTEEDIARLETSQNDCDKRLLDISERMRPQLEAKAKAEHDKRMKQEVYDKAKTTYTQNLINEDNNLCADISRMEKSNADKQARIAELQRMNATDEKQKAEYEQSINELRDKAKEIESRKFSSTGVCPTCGQSLPQEMLEREEVNFKEAQKKEYDSVVARGKEVRGWIENIDNTIAKRNEEIRTLETSFEDVEPLKQKLNALRTNDNVMPFEQTEQGKALQADIDAVVIPVVTIPENNEINAEKERIKAELVPLYERRGLKSRLQRLKENIAALQTEQREKGAELAEYETQRELVKAYKQEQMEILSRKVNDGLCSSCIDVWSKQKDGTMVPDLVLRDEQGVSFACTNNASRIVTTVDVQRFFCDRLGVNMPCWVDECAVVDDENMPRFNGTQMFYMFRADTSLKIETK